MNDLAGNRSLWLTSFWGFDPQLWGGVGFTLETDRARFLKDAPEGSILAIYVTKHKGPIAMRGKLVGFLELTHQIGPMKSFTSPTAWVNAEKDAGVKGKWVFGVRASRAWEIVEEDWMDVEDIFPATYGGHNKQQIGSRCVPVDDAEQDNAMGLWVREVPVYGADWIDTDFLGPFEDQLYPSQGVPPSKQPHLVREADGPKRIYVLRLEGNYSHFLGQSAADLEDHHIVKVGFSRSPENRCKQIQSSYPRCQFKWRVEWQYPEPANAPYPNAEIAMAGEDAMKKRLAEEGKSLGGEFFLVDDNLFVRTQSIGRFGADQKLSELGLQPVATPPQ